ncbi:MAG TPA: gliding motility-associated C-terminal domain-containing protein, partial [Flavobacterium sp.]|nr:gliding motility-associated C-terminal domain-containing protein [Flavobacterium sp.]
DSLPDGTPSGGLWIDVEDTNALNGSTFTPNDLGVGFYNFRYEVTNQDCPYIVELTVEVDDDCGVLPCGNIVIHNAFSPNNDGTNDYFSIENIDDLVCYPSNTLQVYNRWQVLVFETDNYDNKTRCFKGISEGRVTIDRNSELPTGTYFYILQYTTSEGNVIKKDGYIYLSR